ncbi:MAG TPA: class I SAM-dependent methyltransferase [Candidatus Marinimicrobia bacterium]|nr:class I SAM-dependent methyltransferase [Candidatus Neomarinimicrobiota bacterium]HRS52218.1 class I SAM-dependent methyltransferase [Candidatus Neomarinimicrobiota bacterium]HRU92009.1 class I SAM-dependent methyltransferase [Candidatus Neomarinimicrobiota bacterium]
MNTAGYKNNIKYFDEQAAGWHLSELDRIQAEKILKSVQLPESGVILDAGCGTGNLFPILKEIVPLATIIACDISRKMLSESRCRFPNNTIPLWAGYCEELPLKSDSIDVVLNYCIFPHIKNSCQALSDYRRVLKSGGRLLIVHPHGREVINSKHRQIGFPVSGDLLPPAVEVVTRLERMSFRICEVIDREDLYLIEAETT